MFSLSGIFATLAGPIMDRLLKPLTDIFQMYFNKQITEAQLKEQLQAAMVSCLRDIEVSHADALAKTYASFMDTVKTSRMMQAVWSTVTLSQLIVLVWHQMGIPAIIALGVVAKYPSSGTTVEWAYLLLAFMVGAGPVVLRAGPGAGNITDRIKSVVSGVK
jgi:hypothetical protein